MHSKTKVTTNANHKSQYVMERDAFLGKMIMFERPDGELLQKYRLVNLVSIFQILNNNAKKKTFLGITNILIAITMNCCIDQIILFEFRDIFANSLREGAQARDKKSLVLETAHSNPANVKCVRVLSAKQVIQYINELLTC